MVGVEYQQLVQSIDHHGISDIILRPVPEHHLKEIADIVKLVVGVHVGVPQRFFVGPSRNGGHFGNQAVVSPVHIGHRTVGNQRIGVKAGKRRDGAHQNPHGMGRSRIGIQKLLDILVDQGPVCDAVIKVVQLGHGRQLPVKQEVGDLHKTGIGRQLLDGITPITQNSDISINKGDGALGSPGVFVADIQGHQSCIVPQFGNIDGGFVFGTNQEWQGINLTVVVEFSVGGGHGRGRILSRNKKERGGLGMSPKAQT